MIGSTTSASALIFVGLTTVFSGLAAGSPGKASAVHDCKRILKTNNKINLDTIGVFIINHF
jgi:hypothetical protein